MTTAGPPLDAFGIAWRLGATAFFVAANGFFVAAEFALVKARASRVDQLASRGRRGARVARHLLDHLDRYLSACQLGITLASLALGALGEPAVSRVLLAAAGGLGLQVDAEAAWVPFVSIAVAFVVITVLHMTLGEQAPKMWALARAESTAASTAPGLRAFTFLFGPLIAVVNGISNRLLRVAGLSADHQVESTHTAEEIRSILSLSAGAGHIRERERELAENVFRMIELEVRHVVVPRVDVDFVSLERPLAQNLRTLRGSGHSRLPVCEVGLDSLVGFVHVRDALEQSLQGHEPDLRALSRPALFVPDTMSLADFLVELQGQQAHCAAVVDEHGTVIGLAFREDALEEIVGPLGDEFDVQSPAWLEAPDGSLEVRGRVPLPEVCDRLDLELDEDEGEETLGGFVTARLGRLPRRGDRVAVGDWWATVLEVTRRRVQRVRLEPASPPPAGTAQPEGAA